MKITKQQLRRIIKEYGGRPYDPTVPGDYERYRDNPTGDAPMGGDQTAEKLINHYKKWAKEYGHITPASSSVMATYFVSRDRDDPATQGWNHRTLADEFGIDHDDLSRELKIARKEYDAGGVLSDEEIHQRSFKEGRTKISKRQLRRIIKEEKARIDESPITKPGAQWERRVTLRDLDNNTPYATRVSVVGDMITIEFGNSFRLSLDKLDASDLGQYLLGASDWANE